MRKLLLLAFLFSLVSMGCADATGVAKDKVAPVPVSDETPKADKPAPAKDAPAGGNDKYVTIKGKIVWDTAKAAAPKREPIKATKDEEVAAKDKDFNTEFWVVNPKNNGIRDVVVWLAPEPSEGDLADLKAGKKREFPSFAAADIHPDLAKPAKPSVEIDQPCCRFIPHVVVARTGQDMIIKNSAPVPHNAKWVSRNNDEINPLIPPGGQFAVKALKAERFPIEISCSIHPWMKAWVRVFDHPYFAVTDEDGNFEIKNAPVLAGKLRIFIWQENGISGGAPGRFGQTLEVKPGSMDLKEIKFDTGK